MKWILSLFSSEAHINYLVEQLAKASKSVDIALANITQERLAATEVYEDTMNDCTDREVAVIRLQKILSALEK